MLDLRKTIAKGDKHREKHEPFSAEMEYTKALDVDETNVRAIFGLGLVYLEKGDNESARLVFHQLVETKGAFAAKHKHLFNDFGIALRKGGLYVEAAQYYSRALELTDKDENLFYNLARAHYEQFHWQRAADSLARALLLDEEHKPSRDLCRFMIALSKDETLREKHDKPPVPEEVAERLAGLISQAPLAGASHVEPQQV